MSSKYSLDPEDRVEVLSSNVKASHDCIYSYCRVKNKTDQVLHVVEVTATLYDKDKNIVGTLDTVTQNLGVAKERTLSAFQELGIMGLSKSDVSSLEVQVTQARFYGEDDDEYDESDDEDDY